VVRRLNVDDELSENPAIPESHMIDSWPTVLTPAPLSPLDEPPTESLVVARGRRTHLRTLVPADLEHFSAWCEDPFLERMVGSEFFHTFKHVYDKGPEFYEACLTDPAQVAFMVEDNRPPLGHKRAPLGIVRLFNIHLLEGYAFLETIITDQRALKRGYGVEAGRLVSYYGVDVLGLRRIEAKVYEYNLLSVNALRRNGFIQEGVLRQAGFQDGRSWDLIIFGILKDEIEAQRRKDTICYFPEREG
jgi:RimJ/RimL family protein N-acetyltransferase